MKSFQNFSQLVELVGNRFKRIYKAALVLETQQIVSVGSHSSRFGIDHRFFFCWIPYPLRNFMTRFHNFSQPVEPTGNQFNMLCWVAPILKTRRIVSIGSHLSGLRIERCFFFFFFFDSLLFEKFFDRVSEFFSIS